MSNESQKEISKNIHGEHNADKMAPLKAEPTAGAKDEVRKAGLFSKPWARSVLAIVLIFGTLGTFVYWLSIKDIVYVENSYLEAPKTNVSATIAGTLNEIYVKEGDKVESNQAVALIGSQIIYTKESGVVSHAPKVIGDYYAPGQTIVTIVVNKKMRVVGSLEENKGLERVVSGQRVSFTVDTFPGKTYQGTVDEISSVSNDTGVIFSISDKRPIKKFDVFVNFDTNAYTELKSGMSAKLYVNTHN